MTNIILNIDGMTCGGCVKSVSKVLNDLNGVETASVSLEKQQAQIAFDPEQIGVANLISAIEDAGFDASEAV
ncbi:MAG: cation transporter [Neisseria sp.]|nr:cation transporter [Neisseria sp.]